MDSAVTKNSYVTSEVPLDLFLHIQLCNYLLSLWICFNYLSNKRPNQSALSNRGFRIPDAALSGLFYFISQLICAFLLNQFCKYVVMLNLICRVRLVIRGRLGGLDRGVQLDGMEETDLKGTEE